MSRRARFVTAASGWAAVAALSGCKPKAPMGLYCQGGVADGRAQGGECLQIFPEKRDADPTTIGSAVWVRTYNQERFSVRRAGKTKYMLYLNGEPAGSFEHDDNWIRLTLATEPTQYHLRSDRPGAFI